MVGTSVPIVVLTAVIGLLCLVAGATVAWVYALRSRRQDEQERSRRARQVPSQWPMLPRALINASEKRAWKWLMQAFPEYHVAPKLPLARYTVAREAGAADDWIDLLNRTYCTFAIVNEGGRVVGCVDISGGRNLSRTQRAVKDSLLPQCGIAYRLLDTDAMPDIGALRHEFLGGGATLPPPPTSEFSRLESVRSQLNETLDQGQTKRPPVAVPIFADTEPNTRTMPIENVLAGTADTDATPLEQMFRRGRTANNR